ncbi:MAG: hypothetical protein AAB895_02085 [Patescibacteria group bacterium]
MKKFKKVNVIEVKRCFVMSQLIRHQKGKKRYLGLISEKEFNKKLTIAKEKTLKLSEKKLDKIIHDEWKKRLKAYNNSDWYIGEVSPGEIGVWKRAGGLPLECTNGSLKDTAQKVKYYLNKNPKFLKKRSRHTIFNMLSTNVGKLQKEKYLFPIIFKSGTGTNGRKKLTKVLKGDIDDGCMRSIALTIAGARSIKAYIGFPKKI